MRNRSLSRIAISIGCPCGVGPSVSVRAAHALQTAELQTLLVGDFDAIADAADRAGIDRSQLVCVVDPSTAPQGKIAVHNPIEPLAPADRRPGHPTAASGRAQLAWIDTATTLARNAVADAIATGPVSKEVIATSGASGASTFIGHTEHIARACGVPDPIMQFVADEIAVSLVTTHIALADVPRAITIPGVSRATVLLADTLARLKRREVRVVVAALNPHAGEGGMFGNEEQTVISPAMEAARSTLALQGIAAAIDGPMGAETAFRKAFDGVYDGAVALYHDQGTIPMKLRCFGAAVNVTAGLPIVRTSVDHGTGYDIAAKGTADPGSMIAAIRLAVRLVRSRMV